MKLRWSREARADYKYWHDNDLQVWKKIKALVKHIERDPCQGLGRPKALKEELEGWWSRRITDHDRLVYRIIHESRTAVLEILLCRGHYTDDDGKPRKMPVRAPTRKHRKKSNK
jgi:toxin YoeB